MSGPTLCLHAGPPRTATTFLQEEVLERIHSARCLVRPRVEVGAETVRFHDLFLFSPDVWEGPCGAFADLLNRDVGDEAQRDLIISDERMYGGMAAPQPSFPDWKKRYGSTVRVHRWTNGRPNPSSVALHLEKLSEVAAEWGFEQTKIIASTRRQDTRLASGYAHGSDTVRGASQERFERWARHLTQHPLGYYMGGGVKLDYSLWWKHATGAVGQEHAFLLPFELLREDSAAFLKRWLAFLEVPDAKRIVESIVQSGPEERNARSKSQSTWALRAPRRTGPSVPFSQFFDTLGLPTRLPLRWPDFSRGKEIHLTPDLSEEIMAVYRNSNRLLDQTVDGLDLKTYGYY